MSKKNLQLKRDKYKSARGGYSRLLNLHCRKCDYIFAIYQKDGSGNLRRMYMDRILGPEDFVGLENKNIENIEPIRCQNCNFLVAMPFIYKKENRKAFRVFQDAVIKRIKKLDK